MKQERVAVGEANKDREYQTKKRSSSVPTSHEPLTVTKAKHGKLNNNGATSRVLRVVAPMDAPHSEDASSTASRTSASASPTPRIINGGSCSKLQGGCFQVCSDINNKRKRGRPFGSKDKKQRVRRRKGPEKGEEHDEQTHSEQEDDHSHVSHRQVGDDDQDTGDLTEWRQSGVVMDSKDNHDFLRNINQAFSFAQHQQRQLAQQQLAQQHQLVQQRQQQHNPNSLLMTERPNLNLQQPFNPLLNTQEMSHPLLNTQEMSQILQEGFKGNNNIHQNLMTLSRMSALNLPIQGLPNLQSLMNQGGQRSDSVQNHMMLPRSESIQPQMMLGAGILGSLQTSSRLQGVKQELQGLEVGNMKNMNLGLNLERLLAMQLGGH